MNTYKQPAKTYEDVRAIIDKIEIPGDRKYDLLTKGDGFLLQVFYNEPDIDTGKLEEQRARKWYISPYATETEIVETAFAAIERSFGHWLREHFKYMGKRVYSQHLHITARLEACDFGHFDKRM